MIKYLIACIKLYQAGFNIRHSTSNIMDIYRFYWKGKVIRDMADIDMVDGKYYTMFQGHSERLL